MNSLVDFKPIIEDFAQLHASANNLVTPNDEDHHRIKLAMIGFSRATDIAQWDYQHYQFVQNRLDTDLLVDDFSPAWIEFACVSMGYLLGLADAGQLETDSDFRIADAQLPGFMWLHAAEIEQLNAHTDGT